MKKFSAFSLVAATVLVLSGCAGAEDEPAGKQPTNDDPLASVAFSGPWADLFLSTYQESDSDDERQALIDGEISAQEYAYFQDKIVGCLEDLGITAQFASDKSLRYNNPKEVAQDKIAACSADNGIRVVALKDAIDRNPTNLDENEIVVSCLKRTGVVDFDYSTQDLLNGVNFTIIGETEEFAGCISDPLNYQK